LFASWVFYPGLPQPEELAGLTYGQLAERLGKPDFEMPGKFVAWNRGRLIGVWALEAGFDVPPRAGDLPVGIERKLFLGIGPYQKSFSKEPS
jgi:hypothetical protein